MPATPGIPAARRRAIVSLGHEAYPTYYNEQVRLVLRNAVHWARPEGQPWVDSCPNVPIEKALEKIVQKGGTLHAPGEAGKR